MKTHTIILSVSTLLLAQACDQNPESAPTTTQTSANTLPSPTPIDLPTEAQMRAEEEWARVWIQQDDLWITQAKTLPFLFQIKTRRPKVDAKPLSEADHLNGVQWVGTVSFSARAQREFWFQAEGGSMGTGENQHSKGWSDWQRSTVEISSFDLTKKNGQWIVGSDEPTIPQGMLTTGAMRPIVSPLPQ